MWMCVYMSEYTRVVLIIFTSYIHVLVFSVLQRFCNFVFHYLLLMLSFPLLHIFTTRFYFVLWSLHLCFLYFPVFENSLFKYFNEHKQCGIRVSLSSWPWSGSTLTPLVSLMLQNSCLTSALRRSQPVSWSVRSSRSLAWWWTLSAIVCWWTPWTTTCCPTSRTPCSPDARRSAAASRPCSPLAADHHSRRGLSVVRSGLSVFHHYLKNTRIALTDLWPLGPGTVERPSWRRSHLAPPHPAASKELQPMCSGHGRLPLCGGRRGPERRPQPGQACCQQPQQVCVCGGGVWCLATRLIVVEFTKVREKLMLRQKTHQLMQD